MELAPKEIVILIVMFLSLNLPAIIIARALTHKTRAKRELDAYKALVRQYLHLHNKGTGKLNIHNPSLYLVFPYSDDRKTHVWIRRPDGGVSRVRISKIKDRLKKKLVQDHTPAP